MSSNDQKDEIRVLMKQPYQEVMENSLQICGGPSSNYRGTKPREVFEMYHDRIIDQIRKKWSNVPADFSLEVLFGAFHVHGFGGRYTFTCDSSMERPVEITIIEPFEATENAVANDKTERQRRAQITIT